MPGTEVKVNVQSLMLAGFFELDYDQPLSHRIVFMSSCGVIVVGFLMLFLTRHDVERNLFVIQIFFDIMAFVIIKKFTGALACTNSEDSWAYNTTGAATQSCQLDGYGDAPIGSQCMDEVPSLLCWQSQEHLLWYVLPLMVFLAPYYLACIELQSKSQAKNSIVVIDQVCGIVNFQSKLILAFIASSMGTCYPWVMVVSIEVSVVFQLVLMLSDRDFTSVLTLNAVRVGGLLMASVNGLYATYVVVQHDDGDCTRACWPEFNSTSPDIALVGCSAFNSGNASGLEGAHAAFNADPAGQTYSEFLALIGANLASVVFAWCWYGWKKGSWVPSVDAVMRSGMRKKQVDYPVLKTRLEVHSEELCDARSFDGFKTGFDAGLLFGRAQGVWKWADFRGTGFLDEAGLCRLLDALQQTNGWKPDRWKPPEFDETVVMLGLTPGEDISLAEGLFFEALQVNPACLIEVQKWFAVLNAHEGVLSCRVSPSQEQLLMQTLCDDDPEMKDNLITISPGKLAAHSRRALDLGFSHGMLWQDPCVFDWTVNGDVELLSYWSESRSQQAWSRVRIMDLHVSEYSAQQVSS